MASRGSRKAGGPNTVLLRSVETPRLRGLQDIVAKSAATDLAGWPMLNNEDYVLVGGIIVLFSYIDLNLR